MSLLNSILMENDARFTFALFIVIIFVTKDTSKSLPLCDKKWYLGGIASSAPRITDNFDSSHSIERFRNIELKCRARVGWNNDPKFSGKLYFLPRSPDDNGTIMKRKALSREDPRISFKPVPDHYDDCFQKEEITLTIKAELWLENWSFWCIRDHPDIRAWANMSKISHCASFCHPSYKIHVKCRDMETNRLRKCTDVDVFGGKTSTSKPTDKDCNLKNNVRFPVCPNFFTPFLRDGSPIGCIHTRVKQTFDDGVVDCESMESELAQPFTQDLWDALKAELEEGEFYYIGLRMDENEEFWWLNGYSLKETGFNAFPDSILPKDDIGGSCTVATKDETGEAHWSMFPCVIKHLPLCFTYTYHSPLKPKLEISPLHGNITAGDTIQVTCSAALNDYGSLRFYIIAGKPNEISVEYINASSDPRTKYTEVAQPLDYFDGRRYCRRYAVAKLSLVVDEIHAGQGVFVTCESSPEFIQVEGKCLDTDPFCHRRQIFVNEKPGTPGFLSNTYQVILVLILISLAIGMMYELLYYSMRKTEKKEMDDTINTEKVAVTIADVAAIKAKRLSDLSRVDPPRSNLFLFRNPPSTVTVQSETMETVTSVAVKKSTSKSTRSNASSLH